jgi:hypothetical protein
MNMSKNIQKINGNNDDNSLSSSDFKNYQNIYKIITTRPLSDEQFFQELYLYEFSDIKEIHYKINQVSEPFKGSLTSCNFKVHCDDKNIRNFNSFEEFESSINNKASVAIKSISLEYNFLIPPTKNDTVSSYKIEIILFSGLANESLEMPSFFRKMKKPTGYFKIEYVNYIIAQQFITTIKDWFKSIAVEQENKLVKVLQNFSYDLPLIMREISTIMFACFAYNLAIKSNVYDDSQMLFKFVIVNLTAIVVARKVIFRIGSFIEDKIDSFVQLTYINITKGDKKLISKFQHKRKKGIWKAAFFTLLNLSISVIAPILTSMLI